VLEREAQPEPAKDDDDPGPLGPRRFMSNTRLTNGRPLRREAPLFDGVVVASTSTRCGTSPCPAPAAAPAPRRRSSGRSRTTPPRTSRSGQAGAMEDRPHSDRRLVSARPPTLLVPEGTDTPMLACWSVSRSSTPALVRVAMSSGVAVCAGGGDAGNQQPRDSGRELPGRRRDEPRLPDADRTGPSPAPAPPARSRPAATPPHCHVRPFPSPPPP
jgi:hypothetical protein